MGMGGMTFLGIDHINPWHKASKPIDPHQPLDTRRKVIAWIAMLILVITFIPVPFQGF
jgi:hypothetical protein